tara:strand:+ start:307 stop:678 length:372 start_codon:yes stop_codon:yes gene_type:complete
MKILVVEDTEEYRNKITEALLMRGDEVFHASNGQEGLDLIRGKEDLDFIITDLHMPIMDGITMLQELKMDPNYTKNIPVLMLTTEANKELKRKGQQAGVSRWLLKPITNQVLFKILDSIESKI